MRIRCWNWAVMQFVAPALYALWTQDAKLAWRLVAIREGVAR